MSFSLTAVHTASPIPCCPHSPQVLIAFLDTIFQLEALRAQQKAVKSKAADSSDDEDEEEDEKMEEAGTSTSVPAAGQNGTASTGAGTIKITGKQVRTNIKFLKRYATWTQQVKQVSRDWQPASID